MVGGGSFEISKKKAATGCYNPLVGHTSLLMETGLARTILITNSRHGPSFSRVRPAGVIITDEIT